MNNPELTQTVSKFREFHKKDPDKLIELRGIHIPSFVYPTGYGIQISYCSDKWNNRNEWINYIHWWENPTVVCVDRLRVDKYRIPEYKGDKFYGKGQVKIPRVGQVTFLGHAIDFNYSHDDRTKIKINANPTMTRFLNPYSPEETKRLMYSELLEFNSDPETSTDYVCCTPNGKIIFIISLENQEIFAFINRHCTVTSHGIEG